MRDLEQRERLANLENAGSEVTPYVNAIVDAYSALLRSRDSTYATISQDSWSLSKAQLEQTASWFALPDAGRVALDVLANDAQSGTNAAEALRRFLTATSSVSFTTGIDPHLLNQRLIEFGLSPWLVAFLLRGRDPMSLDDAGLRGAVQAAAGFATTVSAQPSLSEQERLSIRELAIAQVEFDRLQRHLEENWLHYAQAAWSREDQAQRFLRLQSYGGVTDTIENELLGFFVDRAAYPLRDPADITYVDLEKVVTAAQKVVDQKTSPPILVTLPTLGLLLEAVTGQCNACETFIDESRVLDLRTQEAKARQEEAEALRRERRLAAAQPDLSDPSPSPASLTIKLETAAPTEGPH